MWLFVAMITISLSAFGQSAQQVLDKTAATIGRKGGASASFRLDGGKQGAVSGTIAIKGNKFFANTPQAKVWFDGKTQWAYLTRTDEVNISTPTQAEQMAMNPYTFINIYKSGYNTRCTSRPRTRSERCRNSISPSAKAICLRLLRCARERTGPPYI